MIPEREGRNVLEAEFHSLSGDLRASLQKRGDTQRQRLRENMEYMRICSCIHDSIFVSLAYNIDGNWMILQQEPDDKGRYGEIQAITFSDHQVYDVVNTFHHLNNLSSSNRMQQPLLPTLVALNTRLKGALEYSTFLNTQYDPE